MKRLRYKIIYSCYDHNDKWSDVAISTRLGEFWGNAQLNPEDEEYESRFTGCEIAEARAYVKYLSEEIKIAKVKYETLKNLEKNFLSSTEPTVKNSESFYRVVKRIQKNAAAAYNELQDLKERKRFTEDAIKTIPTIRASRHKAILERVNKTK